MASYVDRYLLERARRGTDVLGRPLPETDAGMMELRRLQAEQRAKDLQTQVAQQELLKVQQERNRLNQGTEQLIDFPLGGGRSVKLIQVTSPNGTITFKRPEFGNLFGEPTTTTSNTNVLADVLSGNNRNQSAMATSPTLADQFKNAGLTVVEPAAEAVGSPYRVGDEVFQRYKNADGSITPEKLKGTPLQFGLTRTRNAEAAALLSSSERAKYYDPKISDQEFRKLSQKAEIALQKAKPPANLSERQKERVKKSEARFADLAASAPERQELIRRAKLFLAAFLNDGSKENLKEIKELGLSSTDVQDTFDFKPGEAAQSGAGRSTLSFVPGTFTPQGKFDERLDGFAEIAARATLKAAGETRATDEDVKGAKRGLFGIGKDEKTNIELLRSFIKKQEQLEKQFKDIGQQVTGQQVTAPSGTVYTIEAE